MNEMRRLIALCEAPQATTPDLDEAFWWVVRWISGSMRDPDWDDSWTKLDYKQAFEIVAQAVGNQRSARYPMLWRYLVVPNALAKQIISTKQLPPSANPFQSFTTSPELAAEEGAGIHGWESKQRGNTVLVVGAKVPAARIMFGYPDLAASPLPAAKDAVTQTRDWGHQNEIFVRVTEPLPLADVKVLRKN